MSQIFDSARELTKAHEGLYIRFDGFSRNICKPAHKSNCYRLYRVWEDGINVKAYIASRFMRPAWIASSKLNQRVEVFATDEFDKLPE